MAERIADRYRAWEQTCEQRFRKLRENEEALNRLFLQIYGLELPHEVAEREVSIRRADLQREIRSLISYAVGCIFGRYSPDSRGLCYAGGTWDPAKYRTVIPVADNILPICTHPCFSPDLAERAADFIQSVYGEETLEENLSFLAAALDGTGTPREVLRRYLTRGFFRDHCKVYRKRPIYWLFTSGGQSGFRALVYLHRWNSDTLETLRTRYAMPYLTHLAELQAQCPADSRQQMQLKTEADSVQQFAERLYALRDVPVCMQDGVAENYAKFSAVLAPIP